MIRAAAPLVRAAAGAARSSTLRGAATSALRHLERPSPSVTPARHPLTPAALRFERSRSVRHGERTDQTAVTVWFGEGPSLPGAAAGGMLRSAMRMGTGVLGAAALAAMSVIAARKEENRARVIDAPTPAVPVP